MSDVAIELFEEFEDKYPFITVSMDTVIDYVMNNEDRDVNHFYEWVISQNLAENVLN